MTSPMEKVWSRPSPLGYAQSLVSFCTVAAPLLAGFSLAALLELRSTPDFSDQVAMALFTVAAVLLVTAIQVALKASTFQATADERLGWFPEMRVDPAWLQWVRQCQWEDAGKALRFRTRARLTYNAGISAFLLGVVAALFAQPGEWRWPRYIAMAAAVIAAAWELAQVVRSFDTRMFSTAVEPAPPMSDDELRRAVFGDH